MSLRTVVGRLLERGFEAATGWTVLRVLPLGIQFPHDLRRGMPNVEVRTVLDVGANLGQSTDVFLREFPSARVFAFEPARDTFSRLAEKYTHNSRVTCVNVGMGAAHGQGRLMQAGNSDQFTLSEHLDQVACEGIKSEPVAMQTVDAFCAAQLLDYVDLLKVDTEGHDFAVLEGADRYLRQHKIGLVQVEVGMSPLNSLHSPFDRVKAHLEEREYFLFAMYEQVHEWPLKSAILRRCDAVFVSKQLAALHSRDLWDREGDRR